MPATVALVLWVIALIALLRFDPSRDSVPRAIWIPVLWMFFNQSRLPSQWLGKRGLVEAALEEGSGVDRFILFGFILLMVFILLRRSFQWGEFFSRNLFLTALLLYTLVSFVWSDFPAVAFKRWIRDLGNYLVILVVLTEAQPLEAVGVFFRRLFYALIPLSILLIRYYPHMGIHYGFWNGMPEYVGGATSKNTLGAVCMLGGIFFLWDTVRRWADRKDRQVKRILLINAAFFMMAFWLLRLSSSATSLVCYLFGCMVVLVYTTWGKHHLALFKFGLPAFFFAYLILSSFGLQELVAYQLGRDVTLTGRTHIWESVLSIGTNPLFGTGYDTFWLGPRLHQVWSLAGPLNQAHNGYLEFYLNLGIVGLFLLVGLLIISYKSICKNLTQGQALASLAAAFWTLGLFYNITEASFKPSFMCLSFLWGAIVIPERKVSQGVQRPLRARPLPQTGSSRIVPKWAEVNRMRQQGTLKPDHD